MDDDWLTTHRPLTRWLAVLAPVAVGALLGLLRAGMETSTAAMVLVLTVVASAATGDRVAGVVAALAAATSFDFFLTEPYHSLSIVHRDDLELALTLVVVGLAVTEIALWGRRQQEVAQRRDGYLSGLAQLLDLPDGTSSAARAREIAGAVTTVLGADRCEWVPGLPGPDDAVVEAGGVVTRGGRPVTVEQSGLPTDAFTAVPVRRRGAVVGHFRVVTSTHVVRPTVEQRRVAALLADRMAEEAVPQAASSAGRAT